MRPTQRLYWLLILLSPLAAHGEIYRSTDAQGRPVFSDAPHPNAEAVELAPTNTTAAVSQSEQQETSHKQLQSIPNQIRIQQPRDGQVLPNGRVPTAVRLSLKQPLQTGQKLRIRLNGNIIEEGQSTSSQIPFLNRGKHQISAELLDREGNILSRDSVSLYSRWPSS